MIPVLLGGTGLAVTPIGFGAFKIGRNEKIKYPQPYDLPDDSTVDRLLNGVLDLGVAHSDTAPAYGLSEERIGRFLGHRRGEFVLSTKVGEQFENGESRYCFEPAAVRESVARSLRRLRTEVLDILFVHSPANDLPVAQDAELITELQRLKRAGSIRALGFSGKTPAAAAAALGWAEVLMVEYHADDLTHANVIAQAAARGVGVVVKKGLASGRLPANQAIPFVLTTPGVTSLVIGGLSLEHLQENIEHAKTAHQQPPP